MGPPIACVQHNLNEGGMLNFNDIHGMKCRVLIVQWDQVLVVTQRQSIYIQNNAGCFNVIFDKL